MRVTSFWLASGAALSLLAVAPMQAAAQDLEDIVTGVAKGLLTQEVDKNAYIAAQNMNTIAGYQDYLDRFPSGQYRANAQKAIARLGGGKATSDPVTPINPAIGGSAAQGEANLGLSRSQRVLIQQQLTALGYSTGGADGLWGRNTRNAIGSWQKANKFSQTGYVTSEQVRLIGQQAGTSVTPTTPAANDAALEERLLGLTSAERRNVQRQLTSLGYNTYGVDGSFGRNSRNAIAAWQRDSGESVTGYLTADQVRDLARATGN